MSPIKRHSCPLSLLRKGRRGACPPCTRSPAFLNDITYVPPLSRVNGVYLWRQFPRSQGKTTAPTLQPGSCHELVQFRDTKRLTNFAVISNFLASTCIKNLKIPHWESIFCCQLPCEYFKTKSLAAIPMFPHVIQDNRLK